jgi:desulfoferrodoxin (superoxide reductase-like protein)
MWPVIAGGAAIAAGAWYLLNRPKEGNLKGVGGIEYMAKAREDQKGHVPRQDIRIGDTITVDVTLGKLKIASIPEGNILAKVTAVDVPDPESLQAVSLDKRTAPGATFTVLRDAITGISPGGE